MTNPYQPPKPTSDPSDDSSVPLPQNPQSQNNHPGKREIDAPDSSSQILIKLAIFSLLLLAIMLGLAPFLMMTLAFF